MSYSSLIKESIRKYPELKIIDAKKIYKEKFNHMPELAFYKTVSRMAESDEIKRITKGIYCIPKTSRFGIVLSADNDILSHYIGEKKNKGVVVGYQLFKKYRLTTQVPKRIEIYSNVIMQEKRNVGNVYIRKAGIRFDPSTIKMIEMLEILQAYSSIEELNKVNLIKFLETAVNQYNEKIVGKILINIKYKKSTLASLKNVLDYYDIDNNLEKYLNGTSRYNSIEMETLNDFT
jgi:hypothetical protein